MSDDDVFDQTTKQNVSFLKAEADIISSNILLSKASSYSFCRSNRAMHKEAILLLYTMKVRK